MTLRRSRHLIAVTAFALASSLAFPCAPAGAVEDTTRSNFPPPPPAAQKKEGVKDKSQQAKKQKQSSKEAAK